MCVRTVHTSYLLKWQYRLKKNNFEFNNTSHNMKAIIIEFFGSINHEWMDCNQIFFPKFLNNVERVNDPENEIFAVKFSQLNKSNKQSLFILLDRINYQ